jgi:hypothetical protein
MAHTETVPSCVTSYVYFHRSWTASAGAVVLVLGWLAMAVLFLVSVHRRRRNSSTRVLRP